MIVKTSQQTLILRRLFGRRDMNGYLCSHHPFTLLNVHIYNATVQPASPGVAPVISVTIRPFAVRMVPQKKLGTPIGHILRHPEHSRSTSGRIARAMNFRHVDTVPYA